MNGLCIHDLSVRYDKRQVLTSLEAGPLPTGGWRVYLSVAADVDAAVR